MAIKPIDPVNQGGLPVDHAEAVTGAEQAKATEAMSGAEAASAATSIHASPIGAKIAEISKALQSGSIDMSQAIDAFVSASLEHGVARAASPEAKVALESLLRATLEEDPAFQQLLSDMRRSL